MKLREKILMIITITLLLQSVVYILWQHWPIIYWLGTAGIVFVLIYPLLSPPPKLGGGLMGNLLTIFQGRRLVRNFLTIFRGKGQAKNPPPPFQGGELAGNSPPHFQEEGSRNSPPPFQGGGWVGVKLWLSKLTLSITTWQGWLFFGSVAVFILTAFLVSTDSSISNPWAIWAWPYFLGQYILIILSGYFWQKRYLDSDFRRNDERGDGNDGRRSGNDEAIFIGILLALPALLASIVYQIGYGFDPFIHQATTEHISKFGFIAPKTPYYLGQYFSLLWLQQIIPLSIHALEKIVWPIFLFLFPFLTPKNSRSYLLWLPGLWFFLSPILTPYNLALLLALLVILWLKENLHDKKTLYLSLIIILIHPLVGLPILGFALSQIFLKNKWQKIGLIVSALAVPLAFKIINFISTQKFIEIKWPTFEKLNEFFILLLPKTFQLDNILETATVLTWAIPLALIIFGLWRWRQKFTPDQIMALALFVVGALLLLFARFPQVFSNSQNDYPLRLWTLGLLFILPEALSLLDKFSHVFKDWLRPAILLGLMILMIFNIFPRYDRYQKDRLYSVGAQDLLAQELVRADAGAKKFAILTNQMTAVAGLWQYGFEPSPKKPLLYSLPTTDETYSAYLHFVNLDNYSSRAEIKKAANAFGVTTLYIIVPSYWNKFGELGAKASREADKVFWLKDNSAFIAQYEFK